MVDSAPTMISLSGATGGSQENVGYMAQWGPKGFVISPYRVIAMEKLTTSVKLKSDSESDTSGTSTVNTRGREPIPVSFSVNYVRAAGVNPRYQLESWEDLVGKKYPLYIGGRQYTQNKMILTQVDGEITLSDNGEFLSVLVKIFMQEDSAAQTAIMTGLTGSQQGANANATAMGATASQEDRSKFAGSVGGAARGAG